MIGFIGGTGPEGRGLALRFAMAGKDVFIGSRNKERGESIAKELGQVVPSVASKIHGGDNNEACAKAPEMVLITTPYDGQKETLQGLKDLLKGKIVVNVIAPLKFEKGVGAIAINVAEGSAAQEAQSILKESIVVGAFQNASAEELLEPHKTADCDVVVCSDNRDARLKVMALAQTIKGVRGVNGGALYNSKYVEDLTALLININRIHKCHASIKITGLPAS